MSQSENPYSEAVTSFFYTPEDDDIITELSNEVQVDLVDPEDRDIVRDELNAEALAHLRTYYIKNNSWKRQVYTFMLAAKFGADITREHRLEVEKALSFINLLGGDKNEAVMKVIEIARSFEPDEPEPEPEPGQASEPEPKSAVKKARKSKVKDEDQVEHPDGEASTPKPRKKTPRNSDAVKSEPGDEPPKKKQRKKKSEAAALVVEDSQPQTPGPFRPDDQYQHELQKHTIPASQLYRPGQERLAFDANFGSPRQYGQTTSQYHHHHSPQTYIPSFTQTPTKHHDQSPFHPASRPRSSGNGGYPMENLNFDLRAKQQQDETMMKNHRAILHQQAALTQPFSPRPAREHVGQITSVMHGMSRQVFDSDISPQRLNRESFVISDDGGKLFADEARGDHGAGNEQFDENAY